MTTADHPSPVLPATPRRPIPRIHGWWRWAALPFAALYLILLAVRFGDVITHASADADAVSAQFIGQLFGAAPAHAHVVLGTFGWYSTLLFELATKWVPGHREVWLVAPYVMALAGAGLIAWSVWAVAGRFAAGLSAVILICASPATLLLLLSMTQHGPVWFCLAVLAAFAVLLIRWAARLPAWALAALAVVVGVVIGANAASDPLVTVAGLAPFILSLGVATWLLPPGARARPLAAAAAMLAVAALAWVGTDVLMSSLSVAPQPGVNTSQLASATKVGTNFRLWWLSITELGNGDFTGHRLDFTQALAVVCAVLSIGAVLLLPRIGWREVRAAGGPAPVRSPARVGFLLFWCSSAVLLTGAFLISVMPSDAASDRYLVGLLYAAAAVIPVAAASRRVTQVIALIGTCLFALSGVISMAQGRAARRRVGSPSVQQADQVAQIAARRHLTIGYAEYWYAAPLTWATRFRVRVYPVSVCDRGQHLCPFDLHVISSWYEPRGRTPTFLITDTNPALVRRPTPDLGRPTAVYHVGQMTMYVYPYDLAQRLSPN